MSDLDGLPDFPPALLRYLQEAQGLRQDILVPSTEATVTELHEHLLKARAVLDRIEAITIHVRMLLGRARTWQRVSQAALTDEEDSVWRDASKRFDQFTTGRERAAFVANRVTASTDELRKADVLVEQLQTTYDVVSLIRWAVDGIRREVDTRMKMVTFERALER